MLSKIKRAVKNPLEILPYFIVLSKRAQVKQIKKDGQVFYKYKGTLYPEYLNKGNAMSFILDKARKYCRGKGIDIGAGNFPFPGAAPIENNENQNAYNLDNFLDGSLDYVFSSHCLEHLKRWQDALKLWSSKLKIGGILFLYLPHESMQLWRPWGPWVFNSHKWIPTYEVINAFLADNGMEIMDYNPEKDMYWSFYIVARKIK
jgi:SAM-dependent methyltransferase